MDPKGKGMVVDNNEKESIFNEPWVGRSGVRLLGLSPSPSPGSGEAEFVIF
jgi:hypothetical protein